MEPTEPRSSAIGPSLDHNTLDSLQFNEEIQYLMTVPPENTNSFTALLELPAPQAVELLHHSPESNDNAEQNFTVTWDGHHTPYHFNAGANLTFPSNMALNELAARFSVFAGEHHNHHQYTNTNNNNNNIENRNNHSPENTGLVPSNSSRNLGKVKNEPAESDSNDNRNSSEQVDIKSQNQRSAKRKEREKKAKAATKKTKSGANDGSEDAEKLPYVHVRARRGQAKDSHSLAERARREKINERMKLLQELVPGCNKISGMALVLDEIINHVHSLQRQVKFLSTRLAAAIPGTDFNLDSILAAESGLSMEGNFPSMVMPAMWPEVQVNGNRQQYQLQWHFDGHQQPVLGREQESQNFVTPEL